MRSVNSFVAIALCALSFSAFAATTRSVPEIPSIGADQACSEVTEIRDERGTACAPRNVSTERPEKAVTAFPILPAVTYGRT